MFDIGENKEETEKHKYTFKKCEEYTDKELLSMEKEMLGIYISGHPLAKLKDEILKRTNIDSSKMQKMAEDDISEEEKPDYKDGQIVKYAGIITSIKKKFTKNNKIMLFVTCEDLYGTSEIIVFENCYMQSQDKLMEENIVLITGRLSIREEEAPSIIATTIENLTEKKENKLELDIRNLDESKKEALRGMLLFFRGDRNNIKVQIVDEEGIKACGGIFMIGDTIEQFKDVIGEERVKIV